MIIISHSYNVSLPRKSLSSTTTLGAIFPWSISLFHAHLQFLICCKVIKIHLQCDFFFSRGNFCPQEPDQSFTSKDKCVSCFLPVVFPLDMRSCWVYSSAAVPGERDSGSSLYPKIRKNLFALKQTQSNLFSNLSVSRWHLVFLAFSLYSSHWCDSLLSFKPPHHKRLKESPGKGLFFSAVKNYTWFHSKKKKKTLIIASSFVSSFLVVQPF